MLELMKRSCHKEGLLLNIFLSASCCTGPPSCKQWGTLLGSGPRFWHEAYCFAEFFLRDKILLSIIWDEERGL